MIIKIITIIGLIIWGIIITICGTIYKIRELEDFNFWKNFDKMKSFIKENNKKENK